MEDCHLAGIDTFQSTRQLVFEKTDTILETRGCGIFVCRCKDCKKPYLGLAIEPRTAEKGERCNYWVPVTEKEIGRVKMNLSLIKDIVKNRRYIIWQSSGKIAWDQGNEPHLDLAFASA